MGTKKKIVYVIASEQAFVSHHLPLAIEASRSFDVHVVVPEGGGDGRNEKNGIPEKSPLEIHRALLSRKSANPVKILSESSGLRALFKRIRPDLINAIYLKSVVVSAFANMGSSIPLVGTVTGLGYMFTGDSPKQRLLRTLTTTGLRHALGRQSHTLVLSNHDDLREFAKRRITVAANMRVIPVPGVDPALYSPRPEPEAGFRVLLAARMLKHKGIEDFVKAAAMIKDKIPGSEFLLAGEPDPGNPASFDVRQLEKWSREGAVSWIGRCDDMPALYASCHVVCLPSLYREGFPRVLVEAMSCGRAVVTTDMPGCRDVGAAGAILPPGDAEKLADAIFHLYQNPAERNLKAHHGRTTVLKSLSEKLINRQMTSCYREFLE